MPWREDMEAEAERRGYASFEALASANGKTVEKIRDQMRKRSLSLDEALTARANRLKRTAGVGKGQRAESATAEQLTHVRTCATCLRPKPLDLAHFTASARSLNGYLLDCRECRTLALRRDQWRLRYGLESDDVLQMLSDHTAAEGRHDHRIA